MRALLSTIGSRGDVQPLVALACELRGRGHDVRLCVPPDFRAWIESLGIPIVPIGPEVRRVRPPEARPSSLPADRRRELAEGTVATQFVTIAAAAEDCDVIVAATALQIAARSVAEQRGIPYVFVAYCPIVLPSASHAPPPLPPVPGQPPGPATATNDELWTREHARFNDLFGAALNSHRTSAGLTTVVDVRRHILAETPWLAADPMLAPWSEATDQAVFQPGAWILPDERALAPEVAAFLDSGEPPVYFGFGSVHVAPDLGEVFVEAARAVGRRAIVSGGWADLSVGRPEADCVPIGEVNQQVLFRRVAAVVHHGGAGTTTMAALAGAPQVIVPHLYDQHYWARRVDELGIGTAHAPGTPTIDSLTRALQRTLRPDVSGRAQSVAAMVRRDGAPIAARRVEDLWLSNRR